MDGLRATLEPEVAELATLAPELDVSPVAELRGRPCRLSPARAETGPPDFIGVGAVAAGGGWWLRTLLAHPEVRGPDARRRGLDFFRPFCARAMTDEDVAAYHAHFPRRPGTVTGEWTGRYMCDAWTPPLLRRVAPDAKLLVMVADPIERYRAIFADRRASAPRTRSSSCPTSPTGAATPPSSSGWDASSTPSRSWCSSTSAAGRSRSAEFRRTLAFLGARDTAYAPRRLKPAAAGRRSAAAAIGCPSAAAAGARARDRPPGGRGGGAAVARAGVGAAHRAGRRRRGGSPPPCRSSTSAVAQLRPPSRAARRRAEHSPSASSAWTRRRRPRRGSVIAVSKPGRAAGDGSPPAGRTRHAATSVAPFQLAHTSSAPARGPPPGVPRRAGPRQPVRAVGLDRGARNLASQTGAAVGAELREPRPQPAPADERAAARERLHRALRAGEDRAGMLELPRDGRRLLLSSSCSTSPRERRPRAGRSSATLSNSEIVPSARRRASCWRLNSAPGPSSKSVRFPPSRQRISPVSRSIL